MTGTVSKPAGSIATAPGTDRFVQSDSPSRRRAAQRKFLRIAFVTPQYVTEDRFDGGLAHYLHRVASALAGIGHDVHVVTASDADDSRIEHEGVSVHRVRPSRIWPRLNRLTLDRFTTSTYQLDLSAQIYRKLKELNAKPFDLVQVSNAGYGGLVSTALLRVPHVLRVSSYRPLSDRLSGVPQKIDHKLVARLENLQYRLSRNIFSPSETLRQVLNEQAGLERVRVIRTRFYLETRIWDNSVFEHYLKGKRYLLYFGRFEQRKGFHILAQAVPRLLEVCPDAYVAFVGRDMKSSWAASMVDYARAQCPGAVERLTFLDKLPHNQLYPVIAGAHLVVLPSLTDNLPNACLEAMALGKPVIGTRGASFEELITDEETGFLVAPNSVAELSEKMIYGWTHPRLSEIRDAAQRQTLDSSPEQTVGQLLEYYREVLGSANQ